MQITAPPDYIALRVACPVCQRKAGEVCKDPRGNARWGKPHKTRRNAAKGKQHANQSQ